MGSQGITQARKGAIEPEQRCNGDSRATPLAFQGLMQSEFAAAISLRPDLWWVAACRSKRCLDSWDRRKVTHPYKDPTDGSGHDTAPFRPDSRARRP
jgi:hypothetical protein